MGGCDEKLYWSLLIITASFCFWSQFRFIDAKEPMLQLTECLIVKVLVLIIENALQMPLEGYGSVDKPRQKYIQIGDSSFYDMRAILINEKEKIKEGREGVKRKIIHKEIKNKGVEKRIEKDNSSNDVKDPYKCLLRKTKIYEKVQNENKNNDMFLVDFVSKAMEVVEVEDNEEYEKLREEFYKGKLTQTYDAGERCQQNREKGFRQRLAWERQIIQELKGKPLESQMKVVQAYDHKLSLQQKQALKEVLLEKEHQQKQIEEAKTKALFTQADKIRKLKELNII